MSAPILVLGPQRPDPNLRSVLDQHDLTGRIGLITAGWRVDEAEIEPLVAHLRQPVSHLRLYRDMELLLREHPDLQKAYRGRQRRVRAYKEVHRISLNAASTAARRIAQVCEADPALYGQDLDDAYGAIRALDRRLLERLAAIHAEHEDVMQPWRDHPAVAVVRDRLLEALNGVELLLIAGGHVAVLRNRMRFFGLDVEVAALPGRGVPIVAWSAGAMVLTERVVLFYDDPPEGHGDAEILGAGSGVLPGVVLLPHARMRLDLTDAERVGLLARRFAPAVCIGLETGAHLRIDGDRWTDHSPPETAFMLSRAGTLDPVVMP